VSIGIGTDNGSKTLKSQRYTPYHVAHRTEIAGFMTILHGDDRFYNNIFIQQPMRPAMKADMEKTRKNPNEWDDCNLEAGTWQFSGYPLPEEWNREFTGYCGMGSEPSDRYYMHLPVWTGGNVFFNGAKPSSKEQDYTEDKEHTVSISVEEHEDGWYLKSDLYEAMYAKADRVISTDVLGMAFEPEEKYENPDGTPVVLDKDYFGNIRGPEMYAGPFASREVSGTKLCGH